MKRRSGRRFLASLFLALGVSLSFAIGTAAYVFSAYETEKVDVPFEEATCVAINLNRGIRYASLEGAFEDLAPGEDADIEMPPGTVYVLRESITIPAGVRLLLPYAYDGETGNGLFGSDVKAEFQDRGSAIDASGSYVKANRKTLLSLREGADIEVSDGAELIVGGRFGRQGVSSSYCELNLGERSAVEVEGRFECYGYVKREYQPEEAGRTKERRASLSEENTGVYVRNGGFLRTPFTTNDVRSGGNLSAVIDANQSPVSSYVLEAIQAHLEVDFGGRYNCYVRVSSSLSGAIQQECGVVGPYSGEEAGLSPEEKCMFYLSEGKIAFEYENKAADPTYGYLTTNSLRHSSAASVKAESQDALHVTLDGSLLMGSLSVEQLGVSFDTATTFLPIPYKLDLTIASGATFDSNGKDLKFLSGSRLLVESGGTLFVNDSTMVFYKATTLDAISSDQQNLYPDSSHGMGDSSLINNGRILIGATSYLGANIVQGGSGSAASIDGLALPSQEHYKATSTDGTANATTVIQTTALFLDPTTNELSSAVPEAGYLISGVSDELYGDYWAGLCRFTRKLTVSIADNAFHHPVISFTVRIADDAAGSNATTLVDSGSIGTSIEIESGRYLSLSFDRSSGRCDDPNVDLNGNYFLVEKNIEIEAVPSEGMEVAISTSGNSGAGRVEYTLYEGESESGPWTEIASTASGQLTTYVVKDRYFKFSTHSSFGEHYEEKPVYMFDYVYDEATDTWSVANKEQVGTHEASGLFGNDDDIVYQATRCYSFEFTWNSCFAAGTLITMADGSEKKIEDISVDDVILAFDHETGRLVKRPVLMVANHGKALTKAVTLEFADGRTLEISSFHALMDHDARAYVNIDFANAASFIGHRFYVLDKATGKGKPVVLTKAVVEEKAVDFYSIASYGTLNAFANGILTVTPPFAEPGLGNVFPLDENFSYERRTFLSDIATYGLSTAQELGLPVNESFFQGIGGPYFAIGVGKGLIEPAEIRRWADYFLNCFASGQAAVPSFILENVVPTFSD